MVVVRREGTPYPSLQQETSTKLPRIGTKKVNVYEDKQNGIPKVRLRSKSAPSLMQKSTGKRKYEKNKNAKMNGFSSHRVTLRLLAKLKFDDFKPTLKKSHKFEENEFEYRYVRFLNRKLRSLEKKKRRRKGVKDDFDSNIFFEPAKEQKKSKLINDDSYLAKDTKATACFSQIFPINEKLEKENFLNGEKENPTFKYHDSQACFRTISQWSAPDTQYLNEAVNILLKLKNYDGGIEKFYKDTAGPLLTPEQSLNYFAYYLESFGLAKQVRIRLSNAAASATSVKGSDLIIRLPIQYHMYSLQGVANHEIGTHLIRRINNRKQVWYRHRKKYGLQSSLVTEEGLATLNSHVGAKNKLLARAALHYYAVCRAACMSFSELYNDLEQFIDEPDKRWAECLRVKRGIMEQSNPGCFSKDQIYFIGAIEILKQKDNINWKLLYSGKLHLNDLDKVKHVARLNKVKLPLFMKDLEKYKRELSEIQRVNGL